MTAAVRRLWRFQWPLIPWARRVEGAGWTAEWGPLRVGPVSARWRALVGVVCHRLGGFDAIPDWVWSGFTVVIVRCPDCQRQRTRMERAR